jgi:hypothetical protein
MALVVDPRSGRSFRRSHVVKALAGVLLGGMPVAVDAKNNCSAQGGLFYLGNTKNDARSVWLSATSPGSFRLDAAQGNTTVDQWSMSHRGLKVTASPFVSNGNGGVHKLYDTSGNKDCLITSQNQTGAVILPPHVTLPGIRPPNIAVPPIGDIFPGFRPPGAMPSRPVRPPQGITPGLPGGVTPPIGTLPPPQGITPGLPGGVTPPVGTLPPQGITPGLPGGVTPPIGTLPPPQGITPGLPGGVTPPVGTLPPQGITPGLPGGVTTPVGMLPPPQGITPGLPGGVTPPVGTLPPPQGITPGLPGGVTPPVGTLPPPQGITPGLPGGVTPPVGTLPPPQGITPGLPGGVTPPVGTLPPPQGITPGLPGGVTPPVGPLPPAPGTPTSPPPTAITVTPVPGPAAIDAPSRGTTLPLDDRQLLECPDPRRRDPGQQVRPECENVKPMCWPDNCQASTEGVQQVPITPGRDLGVGLQPDWNLWTDFIAISVSDGRYGLDVTGWSRLGTVGLDRRITSNLVVGLSFSLEDDMTGGYGGFFSASTRGLTVSPYAALLLSDNWAIEAALGYSRLSNNVSIAVLSGSYFSQRLSASLKLHGQYDLDFFAVRPHLSSYYVKTFSDGYDMQGSILGQALAVTYPGADYDYAAVQLAVEFNKLFTMANGNRLMPFAEVGALYEAVRPNGGQILTSDLQFVTPSPWSFSTRAGVRMLISDAVLLEARVGYLSFGQGGLDVVEGRLHLSFSF